MARKKSTEDQKGSIDAPVEPVTAAPEARRDPRRARHWPG
jgi:hypothetical protein